MSLLTLRTGTAVGEGDREGGRPIAPCRHGMRTRRPALFTTSGLTDASGRRSSTGSTAARSKGNLSDLPPAPTFAEGWSIGKPDVVLEMAGRLSIPANGTIEYEWFYIPTNFTEPKWVKSIEVRPGNREAVHHVLVYYRAKPDIKRPCLSRAQTRNINPIRRLRTRYRAASAASGSRRNAARVFSPRTHQEPIRRSLRTAPRFGSSPAASSSCRCITRQPASRDRPHQDRHHVRE